MTTSRTDLVMYGLKYDFNDVNDEIRESLYKITDRESKDIVAVIDGMSNRYIVIGYILIKSDEYMDGLDMVSVSELTELSPLSKEMKVRSFAEENNLPKKKLSCWLKLTA